MTTKQQDERIREIAHDASWHFDDPQLQDMVELACANAIRAALADPVLVPQWRTIETAPMDGTVFLGLRGTAIRECYRIQRDDCEMWCFGDRTASVEYWPSIKPTHWMPLPQPPKEPT